MNFGEYLQELLKKYNVSVLDLKNRLGLKSTGTLYRVLNNECSYESTKKMLDNIKNHISFTDDEVKQLYEKIEYCKINAKLRDAFDVLTNMYRKENVEYTHPIIEFFEKFKDKTVHVYFGVACDNVFISAVDAYLSKNPEADIRIIHLVNFNQSNEIIANEILAIWKLLRYTQYLPFEVSGYEINVITAVANNNKGYSMEIYDGDNKISSQITAELAEYFIAKIDRHTTVPIKEQRGLVTDYCKLIDEYSYIEKFDCYAYNGGPCIMYMTDEILKKLFAEANFFGFPADDDIVQNLIAAIDKRYEQSYNSKHKKWWIFTTERLESFFRDGFVYDSFPEFRNLNKEERMTVWQRYSNKTRDYVKLLNENYRLDDISLDIVKDKCIHISNSGLGYTKNYTEAKICHPKAVKLLQQFGEYFWENMTYSDECTERIVNDMISKYIK